MSQSPEEWSGHTSLTSFETIRQNSGCVFASRSRLWGSPRWDVRLLLEQNVDLVVPHLSHFISLAPRQLLDGYVVSIPDEECCKTLSQLATTVRRVLTRLSVMDPSGERCMEKPIESPEWRYRFAGETLFVAAFAPCYPPDSSRYSFGISAAMLLFQPEHAFDRAVPQGEVCIPDFVRDLIRERFCGVGRSYDLGITLAPFDAYRFVKPLRSGDPIVRWWE